MKGHSDKVTGVALGTCLDVPELVSNPRLQPTDPLKRPRPSQSELPDAEQLPQGFRGTHLVETHLATSEFDEIC